MILRTRNLILSILFGMSTVITIAVFVASFTLNFDTPILNETIRVGLGRYLKFTWSLPSYELVLSIISIFLACLVAMVGGWVFLFNFRRITAPELFFLACFWISMSFEAFKMFNILTIQYLGGSDLQLFFSRMHLAGRILGALALFSSSLHLAGVKLKFQAYLALIMALVSFSLAFLLPFNALGYRQGLLLSMAGAIDTDIISIFFAMLTILNLIYYSMQQQTKEAWIMLIHFVTLLVGHEMLGAVYNVPTLVLTWVILLGGTLLLGRTFMRTYLWY